MNELNNMNVKEKIISILEEKGPSLPVHISSQIKTSLLFTSAFLSELVSERKVKISNMKVGNSPIYYLPGQEPLLEKYSDYLKKKEKDAFLLLKEKKILKDSEQEPSIRVALRALKDFAIPFDKNGELFWKYFKEEDKKPKDQTRKNLADKKHVSKKQPETFESPIEIKDAHATDEQKSASYAKEKKKSPVKKIKKKKSKSSKNSNEMFFNKIKKHLSLQEIEISDIISFNKNEFYLIVEKNREKYLLAAFNKKRINESDIIKTNKKAAEFNLNYSILCLGEPLKKLQNIIDAIRNLKDIEKLSAD